MAWFFYSALYVVWRIELIDANAWYGIHGFVCYAMTFRKCNSFMIS